MLGTQWKPWYPTTLIQREQVEGLAGSATPSLPSTHLLGQELLAQPKVCEDDVTF